MTATEIEQRFKRIERELAELKAARAAASTPQTTNGASIIPPTSPNHWLEKIAGTYSSPEDQAAFDEAMRYGREWRESFRPKPRKRGTTKKK